MERLMTVARIEDQGDRILFFGAQDDEYKVIGSSKLPYSITIGDVIRYEPYGENFGWFIRKEENNGKS